MSKLDTDSFQKIAPLKERDRLFLDIAQIKSEIFCRDADGVYCKIRVLRFDQEKQLLVCSLVDSISPYKLNQEILCSFFIGNMKYFFHVKYQFEMPHILLELTPDLFVLQRRENFRQVIPLSYKAILKIDTINQQPVLIQLPVSDLSVGGAKFENVSNQYSLKIGDKILGQLTLAQHEPIYIEAKVRHVAPHNHLTNMYFFGIEFINLKPNLENKLFNLIMEIYKSEKAKLA